MESREKELEIIVRYAIPPKEWKRILDEIKQHNFSVLSLKGGDISFSEKDIPLINSLI